MATESPGCQRQGNIAQDLQGLIGRREGLGHMFNGEGVVIHR